MSKLIVMIYAQCIERSLSDRRYHYHTAIGLALMFCATQIYFIEQIDCLQRLQNLKLI
jgi:hypothetical protein